MAVLAPNAENATFGWEGARIGMRQMLPLLPSTLILSLVFGVLARQAEMTVAEAALQALPGTLLVALIAPLALARGPVETVASGLVVLAMLRTGNLIFAIAVGIGTTALLRAFG